MNRKELLERNLYVKWARAPKRGEAAGPKRGEDDHARGQEEPTVIRPLAPPGGMSKAPIPKIFTTVRPPAHVAAIAAARRQKAAAGVGIASNVPRPGGGPIRGVGVGLAKRVGGPANPYYPSADKNRWGTSEE